MNPLTGNHPQSHRTLNITMIKKSSKLPERPPPNRIRYVDWDEFLVDGAETEKAIKLFWWCERTNSWAWFNFKKVFESIKDVIYHHLGHHLSLPYEEQVEFSRDVIPRASN